MRKVRKKSSKQSFKPEQYVEANDSILQIQTRSIGLAFLIMGCTLVVVAILLGMNNASVADYIVSIFMQFLPGVILIVSGVKVLLPRE